MHNLGTVFDCVPSQCEQSCALLVPIPVMVTFETVRFRTGESFECDDVIRRVHVSKSRKQRAAGYCTERSLMNSR